MEFFLCTKLFIDSNIFFLYITEIVSSSNV